MNPPTSNDFQTTVPDTNGYIQPVVVRDEINDETRKTFPQLLLEILSDENSDIITWLPHGKAFIIYHKKRFATEVLPRYFNHAKFTSFTRKLNRWGFHCFVAKHIPEASTYYHKFFQRDEPRLCMQMRCDSVKIDIARESNMSAKVTRSTSTTTCSPYITAEALAARKVLIQHQRMCLRVEEEQLIKKHLLYLQMLRDECAGMAAHPSTIPAVLESDQEDDCSDISEDIISEKNEVGAYAA